jgi:hypothetical protein
MEKRQSFSSYEFVKDPSPSVKIDTSKRTKIKIKEKKRREIVDLSSKAKKGITS